MNKTNFYMGDSETPIEYEHAIFGVQHGVLLVKRDKNDQHICIILIGEDDENWSVTHERKFSSYWLPDMIQVMLEAKLWIESNCLPDPSGYGYVFKS